MARSWQYPRGRRYLVQAIMWLILGATVALAALVNHERRRMLRVELSAPVTRGSLTVRMPKSWRTDFPTDSPTPAMGPLGALIARSIEPDPEGLAAQADDARSVSVYLDDTAGAVSPPQYLLSRGALHDAIDFAALREGSASAADVLPFAPISVGAWPGVMIISTRGTRTNRLVAPSSPAAGASSGVRKELLACAVLPSRRAIVLKLEGRGTPDMSDTEILRQLAAAVDVAGEPGLGAAGETLPLEMGVRVRIPPGLLPVYDNDPCRSERLAWFDGDARSWVTVDLVPCVLIPEGEEGDERRAVATLAATRDPQLSRASITSEGPRRWKITPPATPEGQLCPTRLYLLADDRGDSGQIEAGPRRALLAVLHGVPGSEDRFETLWSALSDGVEFTGTTDYASMLETGADEARRLRRSSADPLKHLPANQWWLWRRGGGENIGWSHLTCDVEHLAGQYRSVWRSRLTGCATAFSIQWAGDLRAVRAFSETWAAQGARDVADGAMKQITTFRDEELTTEVSVGGGKAVTYKRSVPPGFVAGAWLGALVPQLRPDDGAMILRTDYFPPRAAPSPQDPLSLLVTFESSPLAGEQSPHERIVNIHINGSGQMSRWHINADNVVTRIDLPDGVIAGQKDAKILRLYFGNADEPWSELTR